MVDASMVVMASPSLAAKLVGRYRSDRGERYDTLSVGGGTHTWREQNVVFARGRQEVESARAFNHRTSRWSMSWGDGVAR